MLSGNCNCGLRFRSHECDTFRVHIHLNVTAPGGVLFVVGSYVVRCLQARWVRATTSMYSSILPRSTREVNQKLVLPLY